MNTNMAENTGLTNALIAAPRIGSVMHAMPLIGIFNPGPDSFASVDDWSCEIKLTFAGYTANVLNCSVVVHAAKMALRYGQWEDLFRRQSELGLPFGKSTGKKWDQIGEVCGVLGQEPDHLRNLPFKFEALYQLSRVGRELLLKALEDGAVRPDLTETAARELVEKYNPELKRKPRPFDLDRWLAKSHKHLEELEMNARPGDLGIALPEVQEAIDRLRARVGDAIAGRNNFTL